MHWILLKSRLAFLLVISLAASACSGEGPGANDGQRVLKTTSSCLPASSALLSTSSNKKDALGRQLNVFIDGSQSMAGFNAGVISDIRPLGDILAIIQGQALSSRKTNYFAFGKSIAAISIDEARRFGTVAPFNCSNCDNQESRLDSVLNAVAADDTGALSLIVTDLWLDNKSFAGSPQVALGQPLRAILQEGRAIGVIGIAAPFKGAVYNVPSVGTYYGATELPLYVIAIGREVDVLAFHEELNQSGGPSFREGRMNFSLFSAASKSNIVEGNLKPVGAGVSRVPSISATPIRGVPYYQLEESLAEKQGGQLGRAFDTAQLDPYRVMSGTSSDRTNVWRVVNDDAFQRCETEAWQALSPIQGLWKARDGGAGVTFSFGAEITKRLRPGNLYYLETHYGFSDLATPNPTNKWLREWSLDEMSAQNLVKEGGAFKTLNLNDLATILEQELGRQNAQGQDTVKFGFLLRVDR
jgi:hypothetical protein